MTATLLIVIKASVFALILAIGLRAHWSEILYLWRRPKLLVRSVLAMYVLVPLAAFALVKLLTLTPGARTALLVLAASAGAPLLPRRLAKFGDGAYALSLVVLSSLLAIAIVPGWVALFSMHFGLSSSLAVRDVALVVAKAFLLPLVTGMTIGARWPGPSRILAHRIFTAAGLTLIIASLTLLVLHGHLLLQVQVQGAIALCLLLVLAIAIGHLLGGPDPNDRAVLAIACATRHIGVAILVAATLPNVKTVVLLLAYVFTAMVVSGGYLFWRSRVS